jgi:hypothetical protein
MKCKGATAAEPRAKVSEGVGIGVGVGKYIQVSAVIGYSDSSGWILMAEG